LRPAAGRTRQRLSRLVDRLRAAREIYEGMYVSPYRSLIHREHRDRSDAFLLMGFSELLGIPNPVTFYTLEILPYAIEELHDRHLRLGLERAPEGGFRCC